jgi:hypothetical protein
VRRFDAVSGHRCARALLESRLSDIGRGLGSSDSVTAARLRAIAAKICSALCRRLPERVAREHITKSGSAELGWSPHRCPGRRRPSARRHRWATTSRPWVDEPSGVDALLYWSGIDRRSATLKRAAHPPRPWQTTERRVGRSLRSDFNPAKTHRRTEREAAPFAPSAAVGPRNAKGLPPSQGWVSSRRNRKSTRGSPTIGEVPDASMPWPIEGTTQH